MNPITVGGYELAAGCNMEAVNVTKQKDVIL